MEPAYRRGGFCQGWPLGCSFHPERLHGAPNSCGHGESQHRARSGGRGCMTHRSGAVFSLTLLPPRVLISPRMEGEFPLRQSVRVADACSVGHMWPEIAGSILLSQLLTSFSGRYGVCEEEHPGVFVGVVCRSSGLRAGLCRIPSSPRRALTSGVDLDGALATPGAAAQGRK